jgi:hypothetical protein
MTKQFHEYTKTLQIPAGDIGRHQKHQRPSPLTKFHDKCGPFQLGKCVEYIHVIPNPNPGPKWLAINGATRVEACQESPEFGPKTKLECKIYGNGVPPTPQQLDELFLLLNADNIEVTKRVAFKRSVGAERPNAVFADALIKKLGPKFQAETGVWRMVETYGERISEQAVNFALDVWGAKHPLPMQALRAIATALSNKDDAKRLRARVKALRARSPENICLRASTKMLQQVGRRDSKNIWTVRMMLGQLSWTGKEP